MVQVRPGAGDPPKKSRSRGEQVFALDRTGVRPYSPCSHDLLTSIAGMPLGNSRVR